MVCIDDSAWFLKAWLCSSRFSFLVIFGAFSWNFRGEVLGRFFEGFLLDVTYEDLVDLCLVILSNKPSETASIWVFLVVSMGRYSWWLTSDSSWLSMFWGPSFWPKVAHEVPQLSPKSHFDPWNELEDRSLGVLSFSRGLRSSRLSRKNRPDRFPKPVWPV
jgi:hypothetical protein